MIEANQFIFTGLTYIGAAYIAYLGVSIARTQPKPHGEADETERLGFQTGVLLQFVNGKAWIHFLAIMATWGDIIRPRTRCARWRSVALNAFARLPRSFGLGRRSVLPCRQARSLPNKTLSDSTSGLGASLVGLAVWILLPH